MNSTYRHLDDVRTLQPKIDKKSHDLFKEKPGRTSLKVTRVWEESVSKDGEPSEKEIWTTNQDVTDISSIQWLKDNADIVQIFTINQDRSWTTLNISHSLFEGLMKVYSIMPRFWGCMFTFGRKSYENEFEFPGLGQRRSRTKHSTLSSNEVSYVLRRAELSGRTGMDGEEQWSIRQTAVYHKMTSTSSSSTRSAFLLIAPSPNVEWHIAQCTDQSVEGTGPLISHWNIHRILVADSLRGWTEYMESLEKRLRDTSDRVVMATIETGQEVSSQLIDLPINFEDRQELLVLEYAIFNLQLILLSILDTINGIQEQIKASIIGPPSFGVDENFDASEIFQEFEEYNREARLFIERGKVLKEKTLSSSQLLSDVLSYKEALALKGLALETKLENQAMIHLAEKSTRDAAAMKVLTIITLVYLPTTIVANFFSTQFVQTDDNGNMKVGQKVWLLAAISVPLTVFTIALWWSWVYLTVLTESKRQPNLIDTRISERADSRRMFDAFRMKHTRKGNGFASAHV